jgi:aspartate aminotransferase
MAIAKNIQASITGSSFIRKMFEEGMKLKKELGAENVYDFSIGNPDLPPPDLFYTVLGRFAAEKAPGSSAYMPNAGFPAVRSKIAVKAGKDQGVTLNETHILMTVGAAGGLNVLFKTLLNPEDEVIVPTPYFVEYNAYVSNHGGKLITVPSQPDFSLDLGQIKKQINEKTAAVLINSPHNPTGTVYSVEQIKKLGELLAQESSRIKRTIYLIADEPYREIVYDDVVVPGVLSYYDNSFVVTSFSKSLSLPGERIGYIAISPSICDLETTVSGLTLCNRILGFVNAPAILQRAVAELTEAKVNVDIYRKRRDILAEALLKAGFSFTLPAGAFYFFVKSPLTNDVDFVQYLKKYNILSVPGSGFGGPGYFRLCYAVEDAVIQRATPIFIKAMQEFKS